MRVSRVAIRLRHRPPYRQWLFSINISVSFISVQYTFPYLFWSNRLTWEEFLSISQSKICLPVPLILLFRSHRGKWIPVIFQPHSSQPPVLSHKGLRKISVAPHTHFPFPGGTSTYSLSSSSIQRCCGAVAARHVVVSYKTVKVGSSILSNASSFCLFFTVRMEELVGSCGVEFLTHSENFTWGLVAWSDLRLMGFEHGTRSLLLLSFKTCLWWFLFSSFID